MPKIAFAATSRPLERGTAGRNAVLNGTGRPSSPIALYTLVVALLAGLFTAAAPASSATAAEPETIHSLVNEARAANGRAPLARNVGLDAVALSWANQMAAEKKMYHNPSVGEQIPAGWSSWGENVANGHPTGAAMHKGWMESPGHYKNIMGSFTDIGIAFVTSGGTTWGVQVFATYPGAGGESARVAPPERPSSDATDKSAAAESAAAESAAGQNAAGDNAAADEAVADKAAAEKTKSAQKKAAQIKAAQKNATALKNAVEQVTAQRLTAAVGSVAPNSAAAAEPSTLAVPEATAATRELRKANPALLTGLGLLLLLALVLLSPTLRRRIRPVAKSPGRR
jgi:uncharacterized protein YkwD